MAKTVIPSSSDDGAIVYPVFIDTNLDTHLALIVSDTDTISDLKMKIRLEHPRCFPTIGKVKVNALQVKRRGHFYHLSDSMLVKVAFAGARRSWYVYVDASSSEQHSSKQHTGKPDSSNQLALPWVTEDRYITDNHQRTVDSDSNKRSGLEVQKNDAGSEGIVSKKRLRDMQRDNSMERASESGPATRKKRKTEERNESITFEKDKVLIYGTTDVTSKAGATNQETIRLDQGESRNTTPDGLFAGALDDDHFNAISIGEKKKKNKKKKSKGNIISVEPLNRLASVMLGVQEVGEKKTFKENSEIIHNNPDTVADVAVIPEQDTQQGTRSKPSRSSKKEKRRELVQEAYEGIKAPFSTMNSSKHEEDEKEVLPTPLIKELHDLKKDGTHSAQNNIGSDDQDDIRERNRDVLLSQDPDVTLPGGERVFHGDKDASYKEPLLTSKLSDHNGVVESENTVVVKRKKRKTKKSSTRNEDESAMKDKNEAVNCVAKPGPDPAFDGHLIDETRNDGSILSHDEGKETSEKKTADDDASRSQRNAEDLSEKSSKKSDNKRRKNSAKMSAAKNDNKSVVKHDNDAPYAAEKEEKISTHANSKEISERKSIEESHMTAGGEGGNLLESGAELLLSTETNRGKLDYEDVIEASKECENAKGTNRKKKKVKKPSARDEDAPIMKLGIDAVIEPTSAVPNPASDGHLIEKPQKDECVSFQMERAGQPEEKAVDSPQRVPDRGSDDVIGKEAETLKSSEVNKGQESVKEKLRSRKKKSKSYAATSLQGFPTKEREGEDHSHLNQVDRNHEYAPRMDKGIDEVNREVTGAAKSKTNGLEQSPGLDSETGRSNCIEHVSSLPQKVLKDAGLSEVPSSSVIENINVTDTTYQLNVSNGDGEGIDFKHYFLPGENHYEGAPTNKVKEPRKSERLMKSKKNKEKVDVPSLGTLHCLQKSLLSPNNHGEETSQTNFFTSTPSPKPLSVVENKDIVNSAKKSPEVSIDEMKAPKSHIIDQITTPKMARQSGKRNNGSLVGSSSNSESSVRSQHGVMNNKHDLSLGQSDMAVGKTASKNTEDVVNNSQRMKSLLATPGAIFGDDSSISSADDNGTVDSDASTRTPSDKSVSSEVEGESDSSLDSGRNGCDAAKGKGRRSFLVDSQSSEMTNKSFGEILRSSSRFKKAKLTASQYQEIAENIDFVPDSQPIA